MRDAAPCRFRFPTIPTLASLLFLSVACQTTGTNCTNGTVTFQVRDQVLARPASVHLLATKPDRAPLQNGAPVAGAIAGSKEFPAGTGAPAIARHYATVLAQNGWQEGVDFVAADNALHFYGVSRLGGSAADAQVQVHGATDSDAIPFESPTATSR